MARKPRTSKIVEFLQGLTTQRLFLHGRIHVKHLYDPVELESKARERLLIHYVKQGKRLKPLTMTPEQIESWHRGMTPWREDYVRGKGVQYTPTKRPSIVYEFREGKFRPMRSKPYYHETQNRYLQLRKKSIVKLDELIDRKVREVKEQSGKQPKTGKRSVRKRPLVLHNERVFSLNFLRVEAVRLQILRLDQLRDFFSKSRNVTDSERESELAEIDVILGEKTKEKEKAEKEAFLARKRIEHILEFPHAAADDRRTIEKYTREFSDAVRNRSRVQAAHADESPTFGRPQKKAEWERGAAEFRYWSAFSTLLSAYMKASHKYGVTLSDADHDAVKALLPRCKENIERYQIYQGEPQ